MPEEIEIEPKEMAKEQPSIGLLDKLKTHKFKILGGVLALVILFTPIPFRRGPVVCAPCREGYPCPPCPKEGEIGFEPSIAQLIWERLRQSQKEEAKKIIRAEQVLCQDPRPEVCTMECIVNPPYICGSDGKSYCSTCQACSDPEVEWYIIQDELCGAE